MSKGASGRVVVDIEPAVKRRLYSALAMDGLTLKEWFLTSAKAYLDEAKGAENDIEVRGAK